MDLRMNIVLFGWYNIVIDKNKPKVSIVKWETKVGFGNCY